jgi:hypothetical protein
VIPISLNAKRNYKGLAVQEWGFGMPKHVCGAWEGDFGKIFGRRCKATAIKTRRGAWRCPLHGGLSTGPKTAEGRSRISAAARARWAEYRASKANTVTHGESQPQPSNAV